MVTELPDREILVDLLHNRMSTERQVAHRVRTHSPHQIRAGLVRLVDAGHVRQAYSYYEITKTGFGVLCPKE